MLLRNGKVLQRCHLTNKNVNELVNLLKQFFLGEPQKIGNAKELAEVLAMRCGYLRPNLEAQLKIDKSSLRGLYDSFQETIYHNINIKTFADALAQTLVYGLLMAKLKANTTENITLSNVDKYIPQNFKLIREITEFIRNLDNSKDESVVYYVRDILAVINAMDVATVGESMSYNKKTQTDEDDPYLYFYENFLAEYDSKLRETRGVYYTPPPVVRFIVRAADDILRRDFELDGLEGGEVTALDFAAGTGTFMLEMFRIVLGEKDVANRQSLASDHLLKNFYGFEFLIAPYVIAHLKLSQFLSDKGVELKDEQRINVFLTNTLEEVTKQEKIPFMPALTEETNLANEVKNKSILVITGNPPYSGISQNNGDWIRNLIDDYKKVDGKGLGERNPKWLQDDYVKFIRFAQHKINQAGEGIVAIITNHGFLDNPTFRGMRQSLLTSFNRLYVLDLHGNAKKQEHAPDGGKDENVFDIQQGVAISIFVKKKELSKGVFHADMYGSRNSKYKQCEEQSIENIEWNTIKPTTPFYLFIPYDNETAKEYDKFYSLKDIFSINSIGIITANDKNLIKFNKDEMLNNPKLENINDSLIKDIMYRPFDKRVIYYDAGLVERLRKKIMQNMLTGDNIGLVSVRQSGSSDSWRHCFITEKIMEACHISNKGGEINYLYPLYLYEDGVGKNEKQKRENLDSKFRKWIDGHYGKKYSPEEILGCIYAILHSPNYRKKYAEFLRMDFPRIPFPKEKAEFTRLSKIGNELIDAHLLKRNCDGKVELHGDKTEVVEAVRYAEAGERLYFNKHQYFAPIPLSAYNFQIGGYKPLDKFLKSRKGRELSLGEIKTMKKAANAIIFTMQKMQEIES